MRKGFSTRLRELKWLFVLSLHCSSSLSFYCYFQSAAAISILLLRLLCSKSYTRNLGGAVFPHQYLWGSNCSPCSAAPDSTRLKTVRSTHWCCPNSTMSPRLLGNVVKVTKLEVVKIEFRHLLLSFFLLLQPA